MLPVEIVVWASPLAVNVNSRIQISFNRVTVLQPRGDTISFTKPFLLSLASSSRFPENTHRKLDTGNSKLFPIGPLRISTEETVALTCPTFDRNRSIIPRHGTSEIRR